MSLDKIQQAFDLPQATFHSIVNGFKAEYASGLSTASASGLATMIPSYVVSLPTGKERGTYLSLDLGGSTLRVCAVELLGNQKTKLTEVRRHISPNDPLRSCGAVAFFDWIADTIVQLIQKVGLSIHDPLSMGVCWSFPVDQTSLSGGRILRMGKGFTIEGVEGYDLSSLFEAAFKRKELNVKVTALVNDTVGTLVAHAYANPKTRVGFIYGTGVNGAYPEKISKMVKLKQEQQQMYQPHMRMLVNTEIDIFGSEAYLPLNKYDKILDQNHSQPEFQLYEKMMSGACIGELIRLAALDLIDNKVLFDGCKPIEFDIPMEFSTAIPSDIEGHLDDDADTRLDHFQTLFHFNNETTKPSMKDLDLFTDICQAVSNRAARLAAAAMASLIEQQQDDLPDDIVIGVTGSTYEKYPRMHERIIESLHLWFGPEIGKRIKLELATDGGSIGSALIAMLAEKQQQDDNEEEEEKEEEVEDINFEASKKNVQQVEEEEVKEKEIQKQKSRQSQQSQPKQSQRLVPNNQPPPPPFLTCLFGWLPAFSQKSKRQSNVGSLDDEAIKVRVEK